MSNIKHPNPDHLNIPYWTWSNWTMSCTEEHKSGYGLIHPEKRRLMISIDLLAMLMLSQSRSSFFFASWTLCWIMLNLLSPSTLRSIFWPQPVSRCQKLFLAKHRKLLLNIISLWNVGTILLVHFSSLTRCLGSLPFAPFSLSPPPNLCAILLQKGWWGRPRRRRKGGFSFWTCWGMSD